ncbi:SIMPL domain-containing protein [Aestuariibaculum sp. M13]|uniref:SIMPL domain-containing protein n=1 Tax=Aestuariibaculum sp. M13 TaxID=2967132 RepID=UPI00215A0765|nr:SIMPL domain-containing protein [Aestuariibaculum sp. M13]MCR8667684.1 SIMPL domain-containing protein [Aestuariibaculum sp. M13]
MKNLLIVFCLAVSSLSFAQKNFIDQPYVETNAKVDTLVVPDKIFISILLNEADSKNKTSVEEQEKTLESTLKQLKINTEKDLSLLDLSSNFKNYFLKGQNVVKSKMYSLLVNDAVTAGKVLAELENAGISNVTIERTEYSKAEDLLLELKYKAVEKSLLTAKKLAKPLNQNIGKALYIADGYSISNALQGQAAGIQIRGMSSMYEAKVADPINTEFQKVKFEVSVNVKYALE